MSDFMTETRKAIAAFNNLKVKEGVESIKPVEPKAVVKIEPTPEGPAFNNLKPEEADEPILVENKKRFVLFPINYHEVSLFDISSKFNHISQSGILIEFGIRTGLANVQESRGFLLDR